MTVKKKFELFSELDECGPFWIWAVSALGSFGIDTFRHWAILISGHFGTGLFWKWALFVPKSPSK